MNELDALKAAWAQTKPAEAMKEGNFTVLPEGTEVDLVVLTYEGKFVGGKQTPVVKTTFEVANGEYENRRIWHDFWLTKANATYLMRDLLTLGWKGSDPTALFKKGDSSLMGLGARVKLKIEKYESTDRNTGEVSWKEKNSIAFFLSTYKHLGQPAAAGTDEPPDDVPF